MKKYFYGGDRSGPYFEGWYLKCQTRRGETLALIPALHIDSGGRRSASLQIITEGRSWWLDYPGTDFYACEERFQVRVGPNVFRETGVSLDVEREGLSVHGNLCFGPFLPLKSNIMGPFSFVPGMECSHGVLSMSHSLMGWLELNGETLDFTGGMGYTETDWGCSFPSTYLWTQCSWKTVRCNSLMLSIAVIPFGKFRFTGCICAVAYDGREYRLATYRGARVDKWSGCGAVVRQGKYRLEVELLEGQARPLRAPEDGEMCRTIHESLCAKLRCRFWAAGKLLFEHTDCRGSFEYADA